MRMRSRYIAVFWLPVISAVLGIACSMPFLSRAALIMSALGILAFVGIPTAAVFAWAMRRVPIGATSIAHRYQRLSRNVSMMGLFVIGVMTGSAVSVFGKIAGFVCLLISCEVTLFVMLVTIAIRVKAESTNARGATQKQKDRL